MRVNAIVSIKLICVLLNLLLTIRWFGIIVVTVVATNNKARVNQWKRLFKS